MKKNKPTFIFFLIFFSFLKQSISSEENLNIRIKGIEPASGPTTGETRVIVRLDNFNADLIDDYPHPNCRFGSVSNTVNATYVKCTPNPRKIGEREPLPSEKTEICIQCENSRPHNEDIIPFTVSLLGDFTDTLNSIPYRFYIQPKITWIYPRYGPKDGNTKVEVFGEGFLNFDQNLRCGFGSREVKAIYVNDHYLICYSPPSSIVQKKLPFSISFNNQQNTEDNIPYVYYEYPQVYRLEPNRGPDTGGTLVRIRGQNFNPLVALDDMSNHNDTFCKFGDLSLSVATVISSTEIECTSPPSFETREVPVEISLNNREWTDDGVLFFYYHPPYVYNIHPKIGPVTGHTNVTITGSNFEDTGYVMCQFGDKLSIGEYHNKNKLSCLSPPVEKPVTVNLKVAVRPDEFSSGINTKFRYYATPVLTHIEPMCGPERGFTQISVFGENFPVGYSNDVKCVFSGNNKTIFTNATVMSDTQIKCDSPSVLNHEGININGIANYSLQITLNGEDINGPEQLFMYYKSPIITNVNPMLGPIEGGNNINITGFDFNQPGACNVTARFATYQTKPYKIDNTYMMVKAPEANLTGSTVVQVSLNGQQFEKDLTINYRDKQNTYYYYKCPMTVELKPERGPAIGGNEISIYGIGYIEPYFALESDGNNNINSYQNNVDRKIYYKFVDAEDNDIQYGETQIANLEGTNTQKVSFKAPSIFTTGNYDGKKDLKTNLQLSYDGEYFCHYNQSYIFFNMPNITDINPKFGPLKSKNNKLNVMLDNYECKKTPEECNDDLKCRFKSLSTNNKIFIESAEYVEKNHIKCNIPEVNTPESFNVETSFNKGDDYTNNNFNYTLYDPYIISVEPQMVSTKGNTLLKIHGYGFANTSDDLKAMFGSTINEDEVLECNGNNCTVEAKYIDSMNLETYTLPRNRLRYKKTGNKLDNERFPVEVAVYNDDFTQNNLKIFYYDEPIVIGDLNKVNAEEVLNITQDELNTLKSVLVGSIPCNLDTYIPVPIDSTDIMNYFDEIQPYTNYTCKYEIDDGDKLIEKETTGVLTSFPLSNEYKNLFLCQSPKFQSTTGNAKVKVSLNGYDYTDTYYNLELTDPVNVYKVEPKCGPREGNTIVKIYGTGFKDDKDYVFKWGPQNLVPMNKNNFLDTLDKDTKEIDINTILYNDNTNENEENKESSNKLNYDLKKIEVKSPPAPNTLKTRGGLDYISVSKLNFLPLSEFLQEYYANNYIHTNFEYYYYHQIYIESFYPTGTITTGGTKIMVIGAWFLNKPEYGAKPYCKFGDKITEGEYLSTVRIICTAPEYEVANVRVPFCVSLNAYDFECADKLFTYYSDFKNAKFDLVTPTSGPESGGTLVKIYGRNLTNMVNENEFQCQFEPTIEDEENDSDDEEDIKPFDKVELTEEEKEKLQKQKDYILTQEAKNVPAMLKNTNDGKTYIQCSTPGGWVSGTKANIKVTFDGTNYVDTGKDFYFYKIDNIIPTSGLNTGEGDININGGGFINSNKVKFKMNKNEYKPLSVSESKIVCDMPAMPNNFTGYVDMGLTLNGIDSQDYPDGFYYYVQPEVSGIYPHNGPSQGNSKVKVFGKGFKDDFKGANIGCKVGEYYGKGQVDNFNEMTCNFETLPTIPDEYSIKVDKNGNKLKSKNSLPLKIALNNVSFSEANDNVSFIPYGVYEIVPSSGPIQGGTQILVKGAGFFESNNIRCRFGVPGYFSYTEGKFIDYNKISCLSPNNYKIPDSGQMPFTVPFGIAFNDEEFNPWTESSHTFTFYSNPDVKKIYPNEFSTKEIVPILLTAKDKMDKTFTTPSASIIEQDYTVLDNNNKNNLKSKKKDFNYQPILCKFGKYGTTEAEYLNRTNIKCLSPNIKDDSEIGLEDVEMEVAENGVDFVPVGKVKLKGPNTGTMFWIYLLLIFLILLAVLGLLALIASNWNKYMSQYMSVSANVGDEPHVKNKQLKYLIPENEDGDINNDNNNNVFQQ